MIINRKFTFWVILERVMRLASGFCIYIIFAKYFSVSDFGVLNFILAILAILSSIVFLGADQYNLYKIKKEENKIFVLNDILFLRFLIFLFCTLILFIARFIYKEIEDYFYLILLVLFTNIFFVYSQFIQALGNFVLFSKISVIALLCGFLLKLFFIFNNYGIDFFLLSILFENLIYISLLGFFVYKFNDLKKIKYLFKFNFFNIKKYFKVCLPLMLASLLVTIYFKIEIVLVMHILDDISAGYWGILLLTLTPWFMLCSAITPILNHKLSEYDFDTLEYKNQLNRFFKYYFLISFVGVCVNIFAIKFLMVRFLGNFYSEAIMISIISSLVILPIFLGSLQDVTIVHRGETGIVLKKLLFGLPLGIVLFSIFLNYYGLIGGAISLVLSYYITSIFSNYFFDKYFFNRTFIAVCGRDI